MANHLLRGALSAWMGLIVLQVAGSAGGSGKVAALLDDVNGVVKRALSPDVPAIPDRRGSARGTAIAGRDGTGADGTHGYLDPRGRYIPPTDRSIPQPQPAPSQQNQSELYAPAWSPAPPTLT